MRNPRLLSVLLVEALVAFSLGGCSAGQGSQGPSGPTGPQGPKGDPGPVGPQGAGLSGLEIVFRSFASVTPAPTVNEVPCPGGKRVISGGFAVSLTTVQVGESYPVATVDGWAVATTNPTGVPFALTVIALCGDVSVATPIAVDRIPVPDLRVGR